MTAKDHHVHYFNNAKDGQVKASCDCGGSSFWQDTKQVCEDWWIEHQRQVQRVRSYLANRNPRLEDQADYYRDMASLAAEEGDRALFAQLADELDTRLGRNAPPSEQMSIPFD